MASFDYHFFERKNIYKIVNSIGEGGQERCGTRFVVIGKKVSDVIFNELVFQHHTNIYSLFDFSLTFNKVKFFEKFHQTHFFGKEMSS